MAQKEKKYKWRREEYQENTRGLLMVHIGNGKGKTTCALGLMMRAAGRGLKCCMIQFMKSRNDRYGEHVSAEKLGIEVHTMGDGFTWNTQDRAQDTASARKAWDCAVAMLRDPSFDVVILDELNVVLKHCYLPLDEVLGEIRGKREMLHVVITGRNARDELIDLADVVTEMKLIKHPYRSGIKAQKGVEF